MVLGVADGEGPVVGEDLEEAAGDCQIGWRRSSISLVATHPMEVRPPAIIVVPSTTIFTFRKGTQDEVR